MEGERDKKQGGIVQAVKDVAAEALKTAAGAATTVLVTRAAEGAQQLVDQGKAQPQTKKPQRGRSAKKASSKKPSSPKRTPSKKKSSKTKSAKKAAKKTASRSSKKKRL